MDMVSIGKKLRKLRGLQTATGVAREIGISTSALLAYEAGTRTPRDEIKKALCKFYRVTVAEIFFPEDKEGDG